jgi:hypothetical protein
VASNLSAGQSVDFVSGRNPLTVHNPEISWQNVAVFYDPTRREIQYAGKPQSGKSLDFSHYIFDEASNLWRTTGQNLFPGNGHIWVAAFDPETGDYFFHRQSESSIRWMRRSGETWFSTSSQQGLLGQSNNTITALVYHPNLFGSGDGGLIAQSPNNIFAWRRTSNSWSTLASGSYGKGGQGIYLPWNDTALFGGGDFNGFKGAFYRISAGAAGSPSKSIADLGVNTPITVGSAGGSTAIGKIVIDPVRANRLLLLETFGSERVWASANNGDSWQSTGIRHPFANLAGYGYNGYTANSIPEYGVVFGLTSNTSLEKATFRLWKPNI